MTPLEERLATLAANGETATYGDLARALGLRVPDLTVQLETLMEDDAAQGKPFRAALLRQRLSPDHLPAPGFFAKAAALGLRIDNPAEFVANERRRLQT